MVACEEGYYCMGGITDGDSLADGGLANSYKNFVCPTGFYCPSGTNAPIPCDVGKWCGSTGLAATEGSCDAGYYCEYEVVASTAFDGYASGVDGLNFCMN